MIKVLYVSSSGVGKFEPVLEAFKLIRSVNLIVVPKQHEHKNYSQLSFSNVYQKLREKIGLPIDLSNQNRYLMSYFKDHSADVVFMVKHNHIRAQTLKTIRKLNRQVIFVSWSQDDMFAKHNRSIYYTASLPMVDLLVTQKSFNCNPDELPSLGVKKILFQNKAYSTLVHKKYDKSHLKNLVNSHEVLFIGFAEAERFNFLNRLAERGVKIDVYGSGWEKPKFRDHAHENLRLHFITLLGESYGAAISNSKITLGFLRKQNRDLQTSRSVEVPACGGFLLAERTLEQQSMFPEGQCAEYFDDIEEAYEKITFYLENKHEREKIAANGFTKSREGKFSYRDRVEEIIATAKEVLNKDSV